MRESEMAHAEREDINWVENYIQVQRRKPKFGWQAKNAADERKIPLGDALLADLSARPPGLLFPNKNTGRPEGHILRIIERLAGLAGVTPTTKKPDRKDEARDNWVHRFRDTYGTDQVSTAKDIQDLRAVAKRMGHSDLSTIDLYAATLEMKDKRTRAAANASDRFSGALRPKLVA
jgi:integrase